MKESSDIPEHINVYRRIRRAFGDPNLRTADARRRRRNAANDESVPYGRGREPAGLGDVLGTLTSTMGWDSPIARAELLSGWPEIVGAETAAHAQPMGIEEGTMTIRCDSTAWTTQLTNMRSIVLTRILEQHPAAGIDTVRFIGPNTPSWKRGPRAIPGRGPRDTYG